MGINIEGIKVTSLALRRDKEDGSIKLTGHYELVSSAGRVVATQSFNGYNELMLSPSSETLKQINTLMSLITKDLNISLGME